MKQRKFGKKLVLSKMTVSNLNVENMQAIQAGEVTPPGYSDDDHTCYTLVASCQSQCPTNCPPSLPNCA
jgi:hypothetical protein